VDAICTTIDMTFRQPAEKNETGNVVVPEQVNTAYATQVCTPALAKALCDLLLLGPDYARNPLFAALRYFVDSVEFKALSALSSMKFVRLCECDASGVVRLAAYFSLPFPKPEFPLGEESLHFCLSSH
jgi:hypothetical protein